MGSRGVWMHLGGRGWVTDGCGCTMDACLDVDGCEMDRGA